MTTVGTPVSAPPVPPSVAAPAASGDDPTTLASLTATLTTLLQALVAQQQLQLGTGAAGGGAASTGASTIGGGPNMPFIDPGFSAGGEGHWGFTVEGSPFGTGNVSTNAATAPATVAGGGPASATSGPTGTAGTTVNRDHLLGTPVAGGVIDTILTTASPTAMEAMSEGDWITITDGSAQMHVHTHGVYLKQPNLIQGALQSGKLQVHLHPDGTAHLHDVAS